jgi:UDP-2-acetamido-2,6-beta-L-arabino-hexul-4-ose reductase
MNVGITGQNGFIGWHLTQYLGQLEGIKLIEYNKSFFEDDENLIDFASKCDVIIHLAAMNRSQNLQELYNTNVSLVSKLLSASTSAKPKIYFTSSTQETSDNPYGNSKKEGWELLREWGVKNNVVVGSFVIPNVFGPFGKPNYNSFIATFCHKIANGASPSIINDSEVKLIHVHDLVKKMWNHITGNETGRIVVEPSYKIKVSTVLNYLNEFNDCYVEKGIIPDIEDRFRLQLFNMFVTYLPKDYFPRSFTQHTDDRGAFVEIVRANTSGQFSFSTTVPGITRGNHYHTRKAERFAVIKGKARIQLRKIGTEEITNYELDGAHPSYVDMPIWHTHNITNIGDEELLTLFWINEPYDPENADTYFIEV